MTTMTTTLKIQLHDELHRITVNPDTFSLEDLKARVRIMFPQLDTFQLLAKDEDGDLTLIQSDLDLDLEFQRVASKSIFSPILRIDVSPVTIECEDVEDEPIPLSTEDETKEETVSDVEQAEAETVEEEKTEEEKTEAEEITEVEQTDSSSLYTSLVYCSHCQEQILTFTGAAYYKCINCYDVAICEFCESCGRHVPVHEPSHLLVKLRLPFEQLPPQQKLICLKHVHVARGDAKTKEAIKEQLKAVRSELRQAQKSSAKKESRNAERRKRQRHRTMIRNISDKIAAKRAARKEVPSASTFCVLSMPVAPTEEPAMQSIVNEEECPKESIEEAEVVEEPVQNSTEDTTTEPEVAEELPSLEDQQESWGVLNLMNSFKEITGLAAAQDPDHRIQGVAFRQKLDALEAMGFTDRNLNVFVLIKHLANVERAVEELVSSS